MNRTGRSLGGGGRRARLFTALVGALCYLALPAPVLAACLGGWSVVASTNVGANANTITGTAAISANDVWAVGYYYNGVNLQTLTEHWNGTTWTTIASPNGTADNWLWAIAATSTNDVWVVGTQGGAAQACSSAACATLTEHWNGTGWSIVSSPNPVTPGVGTNVTQAVTALASNDVWAAGYVSSNGNKTLIMHWDGVAWTLVTSPNVTADSLIYGISAVSASDVWAVGRSNTTYATLVEHWNGTAWSIVSSPNAGAGDNVLRGVAAVGASDVWATGYSGGSGGGCSGACKSVAEHWNGTAWSTVASPNIAGATDTVLRAVTTINATDAWATGYSITSGTKKSVGLHWDGSLWSTVATPNGGAGDGVLAGVTSIGTADVWAAGTSGATSRSLIEHWVGPATLSLSAPASVTFPSSTVAATTQVVTTTTPLSVSDMTGTGSGWKVQGTSTTLTAGARTLPTTATTITAASASAATGNCNLPTSSVSYPLTLPAGPVAPTAVSIFNAGIGTGQGPAAVTLSWSLAIPSNAYAGTYASTVTLSMVSGP